MSVQNLNKRFKRCEHFNVSPLVSFPKVVKEYSLLLKQEEIGVSLLPQPLVELLLWTWLILFFFFPQ